MGPVPKDNQTNPEDKDLPCHSDSDELETPNHVVPPADDSSTDEEADSDVEGPANDGYVLLPQDLEEEGGGDGDETVQSQPFPPLPTLDGDLLPAESMTEVRGTGVDVSQAVTEGNVHPAFAASFPDNKVPVHLQVPDLPKAKKDDILWNHPAPEMDRLQLDSAQLSKVKSAMAGFQLPRANIPDWARHIPEDEWKQQLVNRLASPVSGTTPGRVSASASSKQRSDGLDTDHSGCSGKGNSEEHGASGT